MAGNLEDLKASVAEGGDVNGVAEVEGYGNFTALTLAAEYGDYEMAKYLIENGALFQSKDESGFNALIRSIRASSWELAKYLIEKGTDVNTFDNERVTTLMYACRFGNADFVKQLLGKGADPLSIDKNRFDALGHVCVDYNGEDKDAVATEIKAIVDAARRSAQLKIKQQMSNKFLMMAVKKAQLKEVQDAIKSGADVNIAFEDGLSVLMFAIHQYNLEIVQALVEAGADLERTDEYGFTAFHRTVEKRSMDMAKYLFEKGSNVNTTDKDGMTPAMTIVHDIETFKQLVNGYLVDLEIADNNGATCLMHACKFACEEAIEFMVKEKNVNIHAVDKKGNTAMSYICTCFFRGEIINDVFDRIDAIVRSAPSGADIIFDGNKHKQYLHSELLVHVAANNDIESVQVSLRNGADINHQNAQGQTALHQSAFEHSISIMEILLDAGADLEIKNNHGVTALYRAVGRRNLDATRLLVSRNANVNVTDSNGCTPAMLAAYLGEFEILKVLADEGSAALNMQDLEGCTVLMYALKIGRIDMMEYLVKEKKVDVTIVDSAGENAAYHINVEYNQDDKEEWTNQLRTAYEELLK